MKKRVISVLLAAIMVTSLLTGCGEKQKNKDSESEKVEVVNEGDPFVIMGPGGSEYEVVSLAVTKALEKNGYVVDNKIGTVNGLDMLRELILSDECDLIMGYTGNGMYYMEEECSEIWLDPQKGFERIRDFDLKNGVTWLKPAPANNTELLAVTKEFAEKNNIKDMHDFAKYVSDGGALKLATPQYWVEYEQGLPGFEREYGFKVSEKQLVIGSKQEKGVAEGVDGLNCTMVFTTDGLIDEYDLYVIKDPVGVPPIYAPAMTIKTDKLEKYPEVAGIIEEVMAGFTNEKLIEVNSKVTSQGANAEDVAVEYLKSIGVL